MDLVRFGSRGADREAAAFGQADDTAGVAFLDNRKSGGGEDGEAEGVGVVGREVERDVVRQENREGRVVDIARDGERVNL